jgi:hypothetical protein
MNFIYKNNNNKLIKKASLKIQTEPGINISEMDRIEINSNHEVLLAGNLDLKLFKMNQGERPTERQQVIKCNQSQSIDYDDQSLGNDLGNQYGSTLKYGQIKRLGLVFQFKFLFGGILKFVVLHTCPEEKNLLLTLFMGAIRFESFLIPKGSRTER